MATTRPARLLHQRFASLKRALPAARKGDARSLHQARVATRRVRETLPLVAEGDAGRKLRRKVRCLTRVLGPVRELDVSLQLLDEMEGTPEGSPAAIACLRRDLARERAFLGRDLREALEKIDLRKLERRAVAAMEARGETAAATRPRQAEAARARTAQRAARLHAAIHAASGLYSPERLHDVRIAGKKLRYALEVNHEVRGSRAHGRIRTLKRAQDLLGRMHDLEVLIARIRRVQGAADAPPLKVSGDLDRLVRRLETECRQLHAHYMGMRASLLAMCDQLTARRARTRRREAA